MKLKTSELTGPALDWAVAKCEGYTKKLEELGWAWDPYCYEPSNDWQEGGPIIEREQLTLDLTSVGYDPTTDSCIKLDSPQWWSSKGETTGRGPTPLIAAMRCYVASKLGDEVDVPEELT
jgi:hypothetical protein